MGKGGKHKVTIVLVSYAHEEYPARTASFAYCKEYDNALTMPQYIWAIVPLESIVSLLSSPLPKQSHNARPQECGAHHKSQPLTIPRPERIEQKVPREQLHKPRIDQDTCAH